MTDPEVVEVAKSVFYRDVKSGARVWVSEGRVRVERATHTSNPHQPSHKWFQTARPKDSAAYAAKKVAAGEWVPEDDWKGQS